MFARGGVKQTRCTIIFHSRRHRQKVMKHSKKCSVLLFISQTSRICWINSWFTHASSSALLHMLSIKQRSVDRYVHCLSSVKLNKSHRHVVKCSEVNVRKFIDVGK
ncbi:hypothetical protein DM860_009750 [Cuscuta australis]|uniref:Uncharacterized protein n=1 Tax=Cuscuta australis TaxID=267555 RepID=A0A328DEL7_9ASTE|nr:hypothetical protein DM860_009750 [Cuscuta australis]